MLQAAVNADTKTAVIILLVAFGIGLLGGLGIYFGMIKKKK